MKHLPMNLLDPALTQHVDLFVLVLLQRASGTLLPELLEVFGREKLVRFLEVFGGTTVVVPSWEMIETCVRDVDIHLALQEGRSTLAELGKKYDLSPRDIGRIRDSMAVTASVVPMPAKRGAV